MNALAVAVLVALGSTECEPPPPASEPDPALARVYLAIAEEEARASGPGADEAVRVALREALRHAPEDATLRARYLARCRRPRSEGGTFAEGVARMRANDCRGALAAFEQVLSTARKGSTTGNEAALLAGICHYELGEDGPARELLERGRAADPQSADLFLGLIALRQGRATEAVRLLQTPAASADPRTRAAARRLARAAGADARLALSVAVDAGYDSNAYLLPELGARPGTFVGPIPDTLSALSAGVAFRPLGPSGPFAGVELDYRGLLGTDALDASVARGEAGWQLGQTSRHLRASYAYTAMWLGGAPYLTAHAGEVGATWTGGPLHGGVSWLLRREQFAAAAFAGYSGWVHAPQAFAAWLWDDGGFVALRYSLSRAETAERALAHVEHAPSLRLRTRLNEGLALELSGGYRRRGYDVFDDALGVRRIDHLVEGGVALDLEAADAWTVRLGLAAENVVSTAPVLSYTRVLGTVGLAYSAALW